MASLSIARADPARLAAAAGRPPQIGTVGWIRIVQRGTGIVLLLLPCITLHYVWRAARRSSPWPRLFLGATGRIAGARVRRTGVPLERNVVFVSNHVSWIDILGIAGQSGSAFIAKSEIRAAPFVGWLSTLNKTVFVSREDRLGVAEQIDRLRDAMGQTWSVTIFPEGTTDDGRSLLPFKSTLLKVLEPPPPGVMVQPILLDYGVVGPDIGWLGAERGKDNALRVLARRGNFRLTVNFLDPFSPVEVAGRKAIAAESRARIAAALSQRLGEPARSFIGHDVWAGTAPLPVTAQSSSASHEVAI